MKTFYLLLVIMSTFAILLIFMSFSPFWVKIILFFLVILLVWREIRSFTVQFLKLQDDKILVTEEAQTYVTVFQPTSVVTRYLCFLHLKTIDETKSWCLPVSRLEFSNENFRRLKSSVQRCLIKKN